ncbi:MAG TPA: DUF3604 domain-containing protein [Kineosporiaceae bacterium]
MSAPEDSARQSRIGPARQAGVRLLFADLHNHSLLSDGRGDPDDAFRQLRDAGLDVAALTDHASIPLDRLALLGPEDYPDARALATARFAPPSIDHHAWKRTAEIADAHDVPGEFTALRGFEWTEPWLGHVNVWFSDDFALVDTPGRLTGLHEFLADVEPQALFGYNHPGREPGRLAGFTLPTDRTEIVSRMVALEAFNRTIDFLFEGFDQGLRSPIADCLDAGWRPGLIGCSDEHGRSYGLVGKGRTGLWAAEHSRAGVRACLAARHTYATREVGLRLDACLDDVPMGSPLRTGTVARLTVDTGGSSYHGHPAELQVLASSDEGTGVDGGVRVVATAPTRVGEVTTVTVPVPDGTGWLLLRVAAPQRPLGGPHPAAHPARGWALAYASPWYLE